MRLKTRITTGLVRFLSYNQTMNKLLLIDKPVEWTSFDVVSKIRGIYSKQEGQKVKVGHAGTLDPFATGLLIILVGDATKKQSEYMKLDKEYEATLKLGFTSTTGDPEGKLSQIPNDNFQIPNKAQLSNVIIGFMGKIEQTPPAYSAIKVNGQRAYKLARAGKEVSLKPRKVTIHEIKVLEFDFPTLKIMVKCSSGTYIRTLAEDIGKALGCGAYLTRLKRTKIGSFNIKNAIPYQSAGFDI